MAASKIEISVLPASKHVGEGDLSHFQITVKVDGEKLQSHLDCTVKRRGDIEISRKLPGLQDGMIIGHVLIEDARISDLLVQFIENAQGHHPVAEMMKQK